MWPSRASDHCCLISLAFLLIFGQTTKSAQIPLITPVSPSRLPSSSFASNSNDSKWRFDVVPPINATSHLIFDTVNSLLQEFANTHYRNGHNIVPATIPIGTLLYHGTYQNKIPSVPEWTATDPEHSYLFCRTLKSEAGCWQLTLVTTRPLKVLYFDGSSAAKMIGPMDSQDLIAWGEVQEEKTYEERKRIDDLCEWGKQYQLDGFLRMEMDFEIMLCDFTVGVETVSFSNLVSDPYPDPKKGPPSRPPRSTVTATPSPSSSPQPSASIRPPRDGQFYLPAFRVIESGQWHNRFPGEPRAKLDLTRLISFYDTDMFPSLALSREGQERWDHRLQKISSGDIKRLRERLDEVLIGDQEAGSGVDWQALFRVVMDRYADRLEVVQYMLNNTLAAPSEDKMDDVVKKVQEYIESMLSPYVLNGVKPANMTDTTVFAWAAPIFEQCATTHTRFIATHLKLTKSEALLLRAVQVVSHEICRVIVGMWAEGVELGIGEEDDFGSSRLHSVKQHLARRWSDKINGLIAWLDWSVWVKCRPACSFEQTCYLPTWPFFHNRKGGGPPRPPGGPPSTPSKPPKSFQNLRMPGLGWARELAWIKEDAGDGDTDEDDLEWVHPQPRCLRRMDPFEIP